MNWNLGFRKFIFLLMYFNPRLIKLHESNWSDSQNFRESIEFFINNQEIGNQVYINFSKSTELKISI